MFPGIGYGGSCFPKDVKGFINFAKLKKSRLKVLEQVEKVNNAQPILISKKIIGIFGKNFSKKKILFLGITFKENTNDLRNSTPAILYNEICKKNLNVDLYDPLIKTNITDVNNKIKNKFKNIINKVNYKKKYDLVIINNKDRIYKNIAKKYNKKFSTFIFDSRRFLKNHNLKNYEGVGL